MTWLQGKRLHVWIACEFLKPYWALGDSLYGNQNQARTASKDSVLQAVLVIQQKYFSILVYLRCFLSLDTSVCLPVGCLVSGNAWIACSWLDWNVLLHSAQESLAILVLVLSLFLGYTRKTGMPFSIVGFYSTCVLLPPFKLLTAFFETMCRVWYPSGLVISFFRLLWEKMRINIKL